MITGVRIEPLISHSATFSSVNNTNVFIFWTDNFFFSVIEEANWLMLSEDIQKPGDGFDAVICLGNSFAHLPDFKGKVY